MTNQLKTVGKSELRKDAWDKVTGAAQYTADIPMEAMLHGAVARSSEHAGKIIRINADQAMKSPGVVSVITAEDIPGRNGFGSLLPDQPALAEDLIRHLGEPVALVIADSREAAQTAADLIEMEIEPIEAVFDPTRSLEENSPQLFSDGNLIAEYQLVEGDVETAFSNAEIVLEETFTTQRIIPGYIEVENALARWNDNETITVWVSSQHPFVDQHEIAEVLGIPQESVQVKSAVIGGAFGGKEDASLSILTALGAWLVKGTLKMVNTREESFLAHPKRHPSQTRMKIAATRAGELLAVQVRATLDTGAYASLGPAVGGLFTEALTGSYRFPNVDIETLVTYTNSPLSGAMRGFGSPQAHFPLESMVDMLAEKLEMDPVELREKNMLQEGDRLATQVILDNTASSLPLCIRESKAAIGEFSKVKAAPGKLAGVGMALGMQTMGLGAHVPDDATHRLEWLPDGKVLIYLGATDIGQGLATVAEQITAEALGIPFKDVGCVPLDTWNSPNGNTTCASRMTYMAGNALISASEKIIKQLLDQAASLLNQPREELGYKNGQVIKADGEAVGVAEFLSRAADNEITIGAESTFSFPYPEETTPQHLPIGMPHVKFVFGAQIARVEVDPELGTVEVTHLTAVHDVGKVISLAGVEGQIEGGVAMGIGYALLEEAALKDRSAWVTSLSEYLLPTSKDLPPHYKNIILEIPDASGPFGAKGIGEITLVPTAPAIANAIYNAVGVRVKSLPITPEKIVGK
ncbi:MAG: xanthine dehydrogenase family protein molybdopterin-binding subunit [Chloroflexota bacterium]